MQYATDCWRVLQIHFTMFLTFLKTNGTAEQKDAWLDLAQEARCGRACVPRPRPSALLLCGGAATRPPTAAPLAVLPITPGDICCPCC